MCEGETQINQTAAAPQHATVDVEKLARWMRKKLDGLDDGGRRPPPKIRPTIYRVIPSVRQTDSSAYDPKIVSIGPFHRDNEGLRAMEEVKWRYLHDLLARCPPEANLLSIAAVGALVREIRGQYSEEFGDIEDDRFVEMMVLDGCFILELMIKLDREGGDSVSASLAGGKWALPRLLNDLILVENQIPFLVLETLFEAMAPNTFHSTVAELAFSSYVVPNRLPPEKMPRSQFLHLLHMLHYCHLFYLDGEESPVASSCGWRATYMQRLLAKGIRSVFYAVSQVCFWLFYLVVSCLVCSSPRSYRSTKKRSSRFGDVIPSATKLEEAGVTFKRKEYPGSLGPDPREVTFSDGIFEIPYMMLDLATNTQMRNCVAFEQCCGDLPNVGEYFTSYCILMALLLDKESDVDILIENGIIFNFALRPDEVASLFDNACSGVAPQFRDDKYSAVLANVSRYLHSDIHRWRAKLMHDYFSNPWAIVSLVAAVVLLVLTVVQTFYTIYAYHHPR